MTNKGPTLYVPPEYLKRAMKGFAYSVRDKVNSHAGYNRLFLQDFQGLEDGSILITMLDAERAGEALFMFYKDSESMVDEEVKKIIDGQVADITEQFLEVEETIAWGDR